MHNVPMQEAKATKEQEDCKKFFINDLNTPDQTMLCQLLLYSA